ncbi:MAG: DoxX family protein [Xanthomonadaceae bacterium]|nr:DoxX family protein [Xanthomonadaceae bacterium]
MNKAVLGSRLFLGLVFTVFGLNGFLQFLPAPPLTPEAMSFFGSLMASKLIIVVKLIEVVGGLALLSGFFVPAALIVLASITFNIFWFHLMLAPSGMFLQILMLVLNTFLIYANKNKYGSLFSAK